MAKPVSHGANGHAAVPPGAPTGDVVAEIAKLLRSIDALGQGLMQLLEATSTQTEMLSKLLQAATTPTEPEQDLEALLAAVVSRLADQNALLRGIDNTMSRLPDDVGAAVGSQMASALAAIK